jgi:hypothetical protein
MTQKNTAKKMKGVGRDKSTKIARSAMKYETTNIKNDHNVATTYIKNDHNVAKTIKTH